MKATTWKYAVKKLSVRHTDIYLAAFCNFSLLLGIIFLKMNFFRNMFVPALLLTNIAILLTLLLLRSPKKEQLLTENADLLISIGLEAIVLLLAPVFYMFLPTLAIVKILLIAGIQYFAVTYFVEEFKRELVPLFVLIRTTRNISPKWSLEFSSKLSKAARTAALIIAGDLGQTLKIFDEKFKMPSGYTKLSWKFREARSLTAGPSQ